MHAFGICINVACKFNSFMNYITGNIAVLTVASVANGSLWIVGSTHLTALSVERLH